MPKDFHCILRDPHENMLADIAQYLWEEHGNAGKSVQYDSVAARHAIALAHKMMFSKK